jgi:hypothetical protein
MTDTALQSAITNIADGTPNTALEIRDILNELYSRTARTGDMRMKDVSNAYITANFDGTGLGINLEVGWAIANGNNLTRNWDDRFPLPYGTTNATMGGSVGANTVTLSVENIPPLTVGFTPSAQDNGNIGNYIETGNAESYTNKTLSTIGTTSTPFSIKNKSIVTLVTMKI